MSQNTLFLASRLHLQISVFFTADNIKGCLCICGRIALATFNYPKRIYYLGNVSAICLATRFIAPLMSAVTLIPKVVYAPRHEAIGRPVR